MNDAYLGTWDAIPPARPNPLLAFLCRIVRNLSLMRYHADRTAKRGGGNYTVALEELEGCLASPRTVERDMEEQELVRLTRILKQLRHSFPMRWEKSTTSTSWKRSPTSAKRNASG